MSRQASSVRWRIVALLVALSFTAYVLRQNMSIVGPVLIQDVGLSQFQLGLVLAAFTLGYGLFQFPGGLYGDRIGPRRALALVTALWGALNLLVGLVPDTSLFLTLASFMVLRFLMGVAQAPLFPLACGGTTCNWFPVGGWALPNGLQNAGLTLGSAATGPLIVWLMERWGWRQSFILTAPLALVLAAVWWWYARDTPAEHPRVDAGELALISAGRVSFGDAAPAPGAWKALLKNRSILLLTASYFCNNYVFYFFFNWLFLYLVESRDFKLLEGGYFAAAPWLAGMAAAVLGGFVCDRLCRGSGMGRGCRLPAAGGMLLAGGFLAAAALARNPYVAVALLSLCLGSQQFTDAAYWAATISVAGRQASAACGVLNMGGNLVGSLGAVVVPLIVKSLGWGAALASGSLFALVAALLWLWIRADEPMEKWTPA